MAIELNPSYAQASTAATAAKQAKTARRPTTTPRGSSRSEPEELGRNRRGALHLGLRKYADALSDFSEAVRASSVRRGRGATSSSRCAVSWAPTSRSFNARARLDRAMAALAAAAGCVLDEDGGASASAEERLERPGLRVAAGPGGVFVGGLHAWL